MQNKVHDILLQNERKKNNQQNSYNRLQLMNISYLFIILLENFMYWKNYQVLEVKLQRK